MKRSVDALEFKWSQTLRRFGGAVSDASRREAVVDFLRIVAEACGTGAVDVIQRGLLVNQVAHVINLEGREVDRLMTRLQAPRGTRMAAPTQRVGDGYQAPLDGEQAAWTHLLEVALNEPGVLPGVGELPDRSRISSDRDRRIAGVVLHLADSVGEFRLTDVLARLDDPADADRAVNLAEKGRTRANYERTLHLALERIRSAADSQEVDQSKRILREAQATQGPPGDAREQLASIHQRVKERRHYVPRRLIPRGVGGIGPDPVEAAKPATTMEQP
jgi:hypothetical protein